MGIFWRRAGTARAELEALERAAAVREAAEALSHGVDDAEVLVAILGGYYAVEGAAGDGELACAEWVRVLAEPRVAMQSVRLATLGCAALWAATRENDRVLIDVRGAIGVDTDAESAVSRSGLLEVRIGEAMATGIAGIVNEPVEMAGVVYWAGALNAGLVAAYRLAADLDEITESEAHRADLLRLSIAQA